MNDNSSLVEETPENPYSGKSMLMSTLEGLDETQPSIDSAIQHIAGTMANFRQLLEMRKISFENMIDEAIVHTQMNRIMYKNEDITERVVSSLNSLKNK